MGVDVKDIPDSVTPEKKERNSSENPHHHNENITQPRLKKKKKEKKNAVCRKALHSWAMGKTLCF